MTWYNMNAMEFVSIISVRDRVSDRHQISAETGSVIEDLLLFFSLTLPGDVQVAMTTIITLDCANSLFALELVTFAEWNFSIVVEVADLRLENFRTIARTAELVPLPHPVIPSQRR